MFRKGKKITKVGVTCPYCQHQQEEALAAVSSYCRACSRYLVLVNGRASAPPGVERTAFTLVEVKNRPAKEEGSKGTKAVGTGTSLPATKEAWLISADDARQQPHGLAGGEEVAEETQATGISEGAFFGLAETSGGDGSEPEVPADGTGEASPVPLIGRSPAANESLSDGSFAAMLQSREESEMEPEGGEAPVYLDSASGVVEKEAKRSQGKKPTRSVRCYRCYHTMPVALKAKSTQCAKCSAYMSLDHFVVKGPGRMTIRTRGNVTITAKGSLVGRDLTCHDLKADGQLDVLADCSGDVWLRHDAVMRGHLYCHKMTVAAGVTVEFPDGLKAAQVNVEGTVLGDITCSGTLSLGQKGKVVGKVLAVEIVQGEGSSIEGEVDTDSKISMKFPQKTGFNPTIIG